MTERLSRITRDDYYCFRTRYENATIEEKKEIVDTFVADIYDDIHAAALRWQGAEVEATSIALETYERLSKYLNREENKLRSYPNEKIFSRFVRCVIRCAAIDKSYFYRSKTKDGSPRFVSYSRLEDEDFEILTADLAVESDNFKRDVMIRDILERFWEVVGENFTAKQAKLLSLYFQVGMSYSEIGDYFGNERSEDAIRVAINRLVARIIDLGEIRIMRKTMIG